MRIQHRVYAGFSVLALAVFSLAACTASAREYIDAGDARVLAQSACFRVEHLPPDFEIVARLMQDNTSAALTAPDSSERAQLYEKWGRIAGYYNHWKFESPSMPGEDADGRMTDEEIEAELLKAEAEMLAAPFRSATCSVTVYASEEGAQHAFAAELEDLLNPEHLTHVIATDIGPFDDIEGSIAVEHEYAAPVLMRYIILIRQDHVVSEISISATCGGESGQDCELVRERAHSMAVLTNNRLIAVRFGEDPANSTILQEEMLHESPLDRARQVCGIRDFSGCVEEYQNHVNEGVPFAVCRNEHGSWLFEYPEGNVGDSCTKEDYFITDRVNPEHG